ncbi:MAG TPA: hypothetical protein VLV55_05100 [Rhizomicrobium sp.]|nr:hypothetical protein [Rhizomicrobium sp.]
MSRVMAALVAGSLAALISVSASANQPKMYMGIPIAPNGGKASEKTWGGVDDAFALNPDGDADEAQPPRQAGISHDQADQDDQDGDDGPDTDHSDEVLPI